MVPVVLDWGFVFRGVEVGKDVGAEDRRDGFGHPFVGAHRTLLEGVVAAPGGRCSCLGQSAETECTWVGSAQAKTGLSLVADGSARGSVSAQNQRPAVAVAVADTAGAAEARGKTAVAVVDSPRVVSVVVMVECWRCTVEMGSNSSFNERDSYKIRGLPLSRDRVL